MRNAELPASKHLSPDTELSDARRMSGAPKTLMPKSHLEKFRRFLLFVIIPYISLISVFELYKNLKVWLFSCIPFFLFLFFSF